MQDTRPAKQFRPYFTESQLLRLIEVFQMNQDTIEDKNILSYLETFKFKITRGIKKEVYTTQTKETLEQKLGLAPKVTLESKQKEISSLVSGLEKNKDIMSPKEIHDAYFAKLANGETLTEAEMAEASEVEFKLYGCNVSFIL